MEKMEKNLAVIENPNKPSIAKVEVSGIWVQGYLELCSGFSDCFIGIPDLKKKKENYRNLLL